MCNLKLYFEAQHVSQFHYHLVVINVNIARCLACHLSLSLLDFYFFLLLLLLDSHQSGKYLCFDFDAFLFNS
jgi:hypothetical protein